MQASRVALNLNHKTSADDAEGNLYGMPNHLKALQLLASGYVLGTNYQYMAVWWVVEFGDGERVQVCTNTNEKFEAWQKVSRMFPSRELIAINTEDEEGEALEEWGMRS